MAKMHKEKNRSEWKKEDSRGEGSTSRRSDDGTKKLVKVDNKSAKDKEKA